MKICTRPSGFTQKLRIYSLIWIFLFFMGWDFFAGLQAQAGDALIYSNRNKSSVKNLPTPTFSLSQATIITRINTYHWNDGKGTVQPGQIGIKGSGVWQAQGSPGMYNTPNAEWIVYPDVKLGPGTYTITDSDPSTWSQNLESRSLGFVAIYGRSAGDNLHTSNASTSFKDLIGTGKVFSGEARQGSKMWPFKIQITDHDASSGGISGELTWSTLGSVHRIRGTLSGSRLEFTEVEAIQKGSAHLNVSYAMTLSGDGAKGTWVDHGNKSTGAAKIMNR
jgi:hypothetical protein